MHKKTAVIWALAGALGIAGCGGGTQVRRMETDTTVDLSGKWNDTDSRLVAEEIVQECLSAGWYSRSYTNNIPTVIVGQVKNKSHEHINVETFVKDLEKALINSGKAEFVASKTERRQLREEKADQMSGHASEETMKELGNEIGADVMLIGSINTIADQEGNKKVMFYQVNMELIEIETNRKVWMGDKKIKKYIKKDRFKL
jgi:hypothetical protein